jgi:hypothetical protein
VSFTKIKCVRKAIIASRKAAKQSSAINASRLDCFAPYGARNDDGRGGGGVAGETVSKLISSSIYGGICFFI